jgi:hypothetical protein
MFPSGSILWADCSGGCPLLADISLSPWTAFDPQHPPTTVLYRPESDAHECLLN